MICQHIKQHPTFSIMRTMRMKGTNQGEEKNEEEENEEEENEEEEERRKEATEKRLW